MKRAIKPYIILLLSSLILLSNAYAKEITYNRIRATNYASEHCGMSEETKYNHTDYKCWNAAYPECENAGQKNSKGEYIGVDCANFASQALIAGFGGKKENPFSCVSKADVIGKDGLTKGEISVSQLKSALTKNFCFERITDTSKAQSGDILSLKKRSHVVVYSGSQRNGFIYEGEL